MILPLINFILTKMRLPLATKLSVHNGQLLTSTGVPSLDEILGGGQAVVVNITFMHCALLSLAFIVPSHITIIVNTIVVVITIISRLTSH